MRRKAAKGRSRILLVFAVVILIFACFVLFGEIFFQEGNPFQVIRAALQLEMTGAGIVPVSGEEALFIQKVGDEDPLTEFLAGHGWVYRERLGSAIFYDRDEETLYVETRMLTRRYVVYELDQQP